MVRNACVRYYHRQRTCTLFRHSYDSRVPPSTEGILTSTSTVKSEARPLLAEALRGFVPTKTAFQKILPHHFSHSFEVSLFIIKTVLHKDHDNMIKNCPLYEYYANNEAINFAQKLWNLHCQRSLRVDNYL